MEKIGGAVAVAEVISLEAGIPGPRPLPLAGWRGNMHKFFHDPIAYLRAVHRMYGPVAGLVAGDTARVFAFGPEYNERLLRDTHTFHRCGFTLQGPPDSALSRLGHGLVAQNGDEHRQARRLLMPAFQQARVGRHRDDILTATARLLDGWRVGERRDIWRDMRGLTRELVGKTLFGLDGAEAARLGALTARWLELNGLNRILLSPIDRPGTPYHHLMRVSEQLEHRFLAVAERRRREPGNGEDVLSLMLGQGSQHDDAALVGQMCILFIAADEAAHNALTWLLFLLAQHPAILNDLRDELDGQLRGAAPAVETLDALPLLDRVVKEGMRLLPPVVYGIRLVSAPCDLGGYALPQGATVWFSHYVTHMLPDIYPQPKRFLPDRWDGPAPSPYAYLPFGAGPRACIGSLLARMEIKIVLAMILQRYTLTLADGATIDRRVTVTMAPKNGMPMRVGRRADRPTRMIVRGAIREMVEFV